MKSITREIIIHHYAFANIDLASGQAVNIVKFSTPIPMSSREINVYSKAHDNRVMIGHTEEPVKYSLPLDRFVEACEAYAAEINDNNDNMTMEDYTNE